MEQTNRFWLSKNGLIRIGWLGMRCIEHGNDACSTCAKKYLEQQ